MIQANGDRVVVKRSTDVETQRNGIIIPDTARKKPLKGNVISCGKECRTIFKEGDTILFGQFSGTEVKIQDEEFLVLKEADVLCILEEDK